MIRRRVVVSGHVQGVFFRETARRRALALGVAGWIRNDAATAASRRAFEGAEERRSSGSSSSAARARAARGSSGWT